MDYQTLNVERNCKEISALRFSDFLSNAYQVKTLFYSCVKHFTANEMLIFFKTACEKPENNALRNSANE